MWKLLLLFVLANSFFLSLGTRSSYRPKAYYSNEDSDSEEDSPENNYGRNYNNNYRNYNEINNDESNYYPGRCSNNYPQRCQRNYPGYGYDDNSDGQCSYAIEKFSSAVRDRGFQLFEEYVDTSPSEPGAISPLATLILIAVLELLGAGETKDEVYEFVNIDKDEVECVFDRINYIINNLPCGVEFAGASDLFANDQYRLTNMCKDVLLNVIGGACVNVDFSDCEGAENIVEGQVELETNNRVRNIIRDRSIFNRSTELVGISGTYFSSRWDIEFQLSKEVTEFCVAPGVGEPTEFYTQTADYEYAYIPELDARVVRIYYQDKLFNLLVMLPNKPFTERQMINTIAKDPNGWHDRIYRQLNKTPVNLTIPAYNQETLADMLCFLAKGTNLKTIYSAETIQLRGLIENDVPAGVSIGLQKNVIESTSEGCRAPESPEGNPVKFVANYPHIWILHITSTDTPLYIGYTNGPTTGTCK